MTLHSITPPSRTAVLGRILVCVRCGAHMDVIEIPTATIDPRQYFCPDHWAPIVAARKAIDQEQVAS